MGISNSGFIIKVLVPPADVLLHVHLDQEAADIHTLSKCEPFQCAAANANVKHSLANQVFQHKSLTLLGRRGSLTLRSGSNPKSFPAQSCPHFTLKPTPGNRRAL